MTRHRVVYDHQIFSAQRFGGISRYFVELARRISRSGSWDVEVLALAHVNGYLHSLDAELVTGWQVPAVPRTGRLRQVVDDAVSRRRLSRNPPGLVHETYFSDTPLSPAGVPIVVTVYDMIHEKFSHLHSDASERTVTKRKAIRRADQVICISECTRRDLLELIPVDPARVSVVHLGSSLLPVADRSAERPAEPYILYVGDRRAHKNFGNLLDALALCPTLRASHRLVIYGGGPLTAAEQERIRRHRLPAGMVVQSGGGDARLAALYRGAAAFVYPSLYEGFGMPILEAMACECPVACGSTPSSHEVAGGAAAFFEASDPASIAEVLERVLGSPEYADELRALGLARHELFSWGRCAAETERIYRRAIATRAS